MITPYFFYFFLFFIFYSRLKMLKMVFFSFSFFLFIFEKPKDSISKDTLSHAFIFIFLFWHLVKLNLTKWCLARCVDILQFHLKSFLCMHTHTYIILIFFHNIYVCPQYCWILCNLIFLIHIFIIKNCITL